jgi:hypothetical protein
VPTENVISVVCSCGKRLKGPASAAGKKARCPACGNVVVLAAPAASEIGAVPDIGAVPAAAKPKVTVTTNVAAIKTARPAKIGAVTVGAAPVAAPLPLEHEEDGLGAMYELAEQAKAAPVSGTACPQCRTGMDENAVLCTNCGYDTRTGKSLTVDSPPVPVGRAAKAGKPGKKSNKPVDHMAPDGSLIMGIILSAVLALVASLVWIAVAWLTGFAIGYIAILIGIAAGLGMQIGHKGFSKAGGVIAAFMTIGAIFIAKFVVLLALLNLENKSISDIDGSKLGLYFFSPIGLIIIAVGVGAAFRTAAGSMKD